jgi:hypothetical protein
MMTLLIALLLQAPAAKPRILMDSERVPVQSIDLALSFSGFSRIDLIEVVQVGKQEEASIGISSVTIRNRVIQHRQKSYILQTRSERRSTTLTFRPADARQDSLIVVTVPQGARTTISMDGEIIRTPPLEGTILLHDGRAERSPKPNALNIVYDRVAKGELIVPPVPEPNPNPRIIHQDRPDLTAADIEAIRKVWSGGALVVVYEATVTETGQVIEVHQTSQLPARFPRDVMRKIEEAAMRFSYEPYVINGTASPFTTTIAVEVPH